MKAKKNLFPDLRFQCPTPFSPDAGPVPGRSGPREGLLH
jgi:hypothetical protein